MGSGLAQDWLILVCTHGIHKCCNLLHYVNCSKLSKFEPANYTILKYLKIVYQQNFAIINYFLKQGQQFNVQLRVQIIHQSQWPLEQKYVGIKTTLNCHFVSEHYYNLWKPSNQKRPLLGIGLQGEGVPPPKVVGQVGDDLFHKAT